MIEANNAMTVLIVEDDVDLANAMKADLTQFGFRCLVAANGSEALKIISTESPDGIISDLKMPMVDGMQLLKAIRDGGLETPFMLLTGYNAAGIADQAGALGAHAVLEKPFDRMRLRAMVAKMILKRANGRTQVA